MGAPWVFKIIMLLIGAALVTSWLPAGTHYATRIQNTAPKVTIIAPTVATRFQWNAIVPYHIAVIDKEDGNSAYDEIPPAQVFLSIRYLPDSTQLKNYLRLESRIYQDVLFSMSTTTCFNCHQMRTKLIGPSFEAIAQKYPDNEASAQTLAQKVIAGTSGTWGDIAMPPHPDLKPEKVQQIVRWILRNGADPDQNHLPGIEGVFRTKQKPSGDSRKGIYVLTASYADTGDGMTPESRKIGQHTTVLKSKE